MLARDERGRRMHDKQRGAAQAVVDAIGQVTLGAAVMFENLSVVPLMRDDERNADYITLDEAIADGRAHITEVSDDGQVSELKIAVT